MERALQKLRERERKNAREKGHRKRKTHLTSIAQRGVSMEGKLIASSGWKKVDL